MTRIGLLGAGTVGGSLAQLLTRRSTIPAQISYALVRDTRKPRPSELTLLLTTDTQQVLEHSDLLVEVMGGTTLAGDLLLEALSQGKRVVTANKAVLAERWDEFLPFIRQGNVYFEAAVMAGTPAIEPLSGSLRGSEPLEMHAILNGTCNYIITQLERNKLYDVALKEAQELGYAEADPTLDVGGFDSAHKLNLLARLMFDPEISWEQVKANTRGIDTLTPTAVKQAGQEGGRVQLVGSVYPDADSWQCCVRPVILPSSHPLTSVASNRNALHFKGDAVGDVVITGAGAGGLPTASGVLADVLAALAGRPGPQPRLGTAPVPQDYAVQPLEEL